MNNYSPYQFSLFRIYLGVYIFLVLLLSIPSSAALWSNQGMVSNPAFNLTYGVFPNILNKFDSPFQIICFLVILLMLSLLFIAGILRRFIALLLWYGWTCLINRNNLITNPAIPYTGWLLLACSVIPAGETFSSSGKNDLWYMPSLILKTAWILFTMGYFFSGLDKLFSASWNEGTALKKILGCPLAFDYNHLIPYFSSWVIKFLTWLVIAIELSVLPLAVFKKTRRWAWLFATCLQFAILISLNIAPIVYGMLAIHLFVFDRRWLGKTRSFNKKNLRLIKVAG